MLAVQTQVQVVGADAERKALPHIPKGREGGANAGLTSRKRGLIGGGEPGRGCPGDFRFQVYPMGGGGIDDALPGLPALAIMINGFQRGFHVPIVEAFGDDAPGLIAFRVVPMLQRGEHQFFSLMSGMRQVIAPGVEVAECQRPEELLDGPLVLGIEHIALVPGAVYLFLPLHQGTVVSIVSVRIEAFGAFR